MPANSAGAGSQKRVTGTRGRIPLAGLVLAALPAQGPRVHRLFPGAVPACDRWRFWRRDHHAAGWRLEQAETGLTARRGTAGHRGLLRWIGRLSSLPPRGIARSVAPAFPPRPGRLLCGPSRAEPSVGPGDVSPSAKPPVSGHAITKRPAPRWNRPSNREIAMMAAKLPSQALPQSLEAAKRSIISVSTGLSQREYPRP